MHTWIYAYVCVGYILNHINFSFPFNITYLNHKNQLLFKYITTFYSIESKEMNGSSQFCCVTGTVVLLQSYSQYLGL
jgi:hypothetical protein